LVLYRSKSIFKYDEFGNQTEVKINDNGKTFFRKYVRKYDQLDNWNIMRLSLNNGPNKIHVRKIQYFD